MPIYCGLSIVTPGAVTGEVLRSECFDHRFGFNFDFSTSSQGGEFVDIAEGVIPGFGVPKVLDSGSEVVRVAIVEESAPLLRASRSDRLSAAIDLIDVCVAILNVLLLYFLFRVGRRIAVADERRINTRNLRTFWLRSVIVERSFHLVAELYDQTRRNTSGLIETIEEQNGVGEGLEIGRVSRKGKKFSGEFSDSFGSVVSRFLTPLQSILPECAAKVEERLERFEAVSTLFFADPDPSTRGDVESEIALGPSEIMRLLWQAEENLISTDVSGVDAQGSVWKVFSARLAVMGRRLLAKRGTQ